jgi:hypothetical protein
MTYPRTKQGVRDLNGPQKNMRTQPKRCVDGAHAWVHSPTCDACGDWYYMDSGPCENVCNKCGVHK